MEHTGSSRRSTYAPQPVIETHPDSIVDLRLDAPFPALKAYADAWKIDSSQDSLSLSHCPYVVILLKCLDEYGTNLPSSREEKEAFKSLVKRKMENSGLDDAENFKEALAATYHAYSPTRLSAEASKILSDPKCDSINAKSDPFWILARGGIIHAHPNSLVRDFMNENGSGLPPVAGTLPDMKADTGSYVALQTLYRDQARADVSRVAAHVSRILASQSLPPERIPYVDIERFCKQIQYIRVLRYSSLTSDVRIEAELSALDSGAVWYVLFRAQDAFFDKHKRYPGTLDSVEPDIALLKSCVGTLLSSWDIPLDAVPDDHIHEWVRAGGCEMHCMAAMQGGIIAQEIIKLLTHQYVPLDNTFIFNGIKSTSSSLRL